MNDDESACGHVVLCVDLPITLGDTVPAGTHPAHHGVLHESVAGNTVVKQAPASPGGPSLAEETDPACDRVDPPAAVDVTSEICEEVEGSQRAPRSLGCVS